MEQIPEWLIFLLGFFSGTTVMWVLMNVFVVLPILKNNVKRKRK